MARTGDIAPELIFNTIVRSPGNAPWTHDQLVGKLTILEFYPKLSTSQMYRVHNQRVERFPGVQFVLIVRDDESALRRWLEKYRIEVGGWLLLDSRWHTARAFGIYRPQTIFIDSTGRVLGISRLDDDTDRQIEAMVAGRADSANLHPQSDFHGTLTPALPPSETVHITPAENATSTTRAFGPEYWVALGYTLKGLIAEAWQVHESLMNLSPSLDTDTRYDVRLVLPAEESRERIAARIQRAIEQQFHLEVSYEVRSVDVYIVDGERGPISSDAQAGSVGWTVMQGPGVPIPLRQLSVLGKGFDPLCPSIPFSCGWIALQETDRAGYQGLELFWLGKTIESVPRVLQEELGITVSREEIEVLIIRPHPPGPHSIRKA
jgi:peroxiredoxin